jgi:hypothetical protein
MCVEYLMRCVLCLWCVLQDAARNGKGKLTADVQMYAQTAVEVAIAKGVPYVDMYNIIMGIKSWDVSARVRNTKGSFLYHALHRPPPTHTQARTHARAHARIHMPVLLTRTTLYIHTALQFLYFTQSWLSS